MLGKAFEYARFFMVGINLVNSNVIQIAHNWGKNGRNNCGFPSLVYVKMSHFM